MEFLDRPGSDGAFGALLDEYARAAEEFCAVAEAFDAARFAAERPSDDPDTVSPHTICRHIVRSAETYATYLRDAQGLDSPPPAPPTLDAPADVRPALAARLRWTESLAAPLRDRPEAELMAMTSRVRWGQLYDPEILLEHAICHLLRHRRQLTRW